MSNFPPELLFDILSRFPPKDLIRFLCVSKAWNAVILHHYFIKAHLQRSIQTNSARTILLKSARPILPRSMDSESPPSDFFLSTFDGSETFGTAVKIEQPLKCPDKYTQILGCSIHGVVCIWNGDRTNVVALWNPSIQKFEKIPLPAIEQQQPSPNDHICVGFGYDLVNDDFKLLRIAEFVNREIVLARSQVSV